MNETIPFNQAEFSSSADFLSFYEPEAFFDGVGAAGVEKGPALASAYTAGRTIESN